MKKCSVEDCRKEHHAKTFCYFHYTRSTDGFLQKCYKNMRQRVTGIQSSKAHIYLGLDILQKDLFVSVSKTNSDFLRLFKEYQQNNYDRKLAPSVDRIDSTKGYTVDNIRWIPNWLNCSYGATSDKRYEE